jgi:hypothetical protein
VILSEFFISVVSLLHHCVFVCFVFSFVSYVKGLSLYPNTRGLTLSSTLLNKRKKEASVGRKACGADVGSLGWKKNIWHMGVKMLVDRSAQFMSAVPVRDTFTSRVLVRSQKVTITSRIAN